MPSTILYLDTTQSRLMVGLSQNGEMIGSYEQSCESHRYHSALMTPAIQDLLAQNGLRPKDLNALAVNHGPGSFTGIRTGIITARTMAQFLNIPVYVFNSFELLAFDALQALEKAPVKTISSPIAIHIDARRGRSYHAVLYYDAQGPVYLTAPELKPLEAPSIPVETASERTLETQAPQAHADAAAHPRLLLSEPLQAFFQGTTQEEPSRILPQTPESLCTPPVMCSLIARYETFFRRSWQDVRPLYLQEPSITLKPSASQSSNATPSRTST